MIRVRLLNNIKKIGLESLSSLLTLIILTIQVVLLILLTNKIGRLEQAFIHLVGGGVPPALVVVERIPDERGQVLGKEEATVTVVMFSDFECPYCADAAQGVKELLAKYPAQVRFVYRHFPLTGVHSNAFRAAEAAECAGEQGKFWELHDALFDNQAALEENNLQEYAITIGLDMDQFNDCMTSERMRKAIEQDLADGQKYGVNGTPTFFVNNVMLFSISELEAAVQQALTRRDE